LADAYPAASPPAGTAYYLQTGFIGAVCYRSCLNVRVSRVGVYLSIFPLFRFAHPPLLIPWSDVGSLPRPAGTHLRLCELPVGTPLITTVSLPSAVFQEVDYLQLREVAANDELPQGPASPDRASRDS
jgi:hypothetical protein